MVENISIVNLFTLIRIRSIRMTLQKLREQKNTVYLNKNNISRGEAKSIKTIRIGKSILNKIPSFIYIYNVYGIKSRLKFFIKTLKTSDDTNTASEYCS